MIDNQEVKLSWWPRKPLTSSIISCVSSCILPLVYFSAVQLLCVALISTSQAVLSQITHGRFATVQKTSPLIFFFRLIYQRSTKILIRLFCQYWAVALNLINQSILCLSQISINYIFWPKSNPFLAVPTLRKPFMLLFVWDMITEMRFLLAFSRPPLPVFNWCGMLLLVF